MLQRLVGLELIVGYRFPTYVQVPCSPQPQDLNPRLHCSLFYQGNGVSIHINAHSIWKPLLQNGLLR